MKTHKHLIARAAVVAVFCVAVGSIGVAAKPKPLKGRFSGSGFTFSGQLTHLGRFTGEITSFTPTPTGGDTTATWTAANGDQVFVSTVFTVTGFNPSTGFFTFSQAITIVGGNGRFAGATGSATAVGETAGDFSSYSGNINGSIDY